MVLGRSGTLQGRPRSGLNGIAAHAASDLETLVELVARDLGIVLVPEAIAEARRSSLGIIQIAQTELCWELVVAYAAGESMDHSPRTTRPVFLELLYAQGDWAEER